jgi:hypothetical protein
MYNILSKGLNKNIGLDKEVYIKGLKEIYENEFNNEINTLFKNYSTLTKVERVNSILKFVIKYFIKKQNLPIEYVNEISSNIKKK